MKSLIVTTIIALAVSAELATAQTGTDPKIGVAVRQDAPPFIWVDDPEGVRAGTAKPCDGYFCDICFKAAERARFDPYPVLIDATQRREFLKNGQLPDGVPVVNMLCDPTTITLARLKNFDDTEGTAGRLEFSPVVFVAIGSYAKRIRFNPNENYSGIGKIESRDSRCKLIVDQHEEWKYPERKSHSADNTDNGATINENSETSGVEKSWWKPAFKREHRTSVEDGMPDEIWGYVEGATIGTVVKESIRRVTGETLVCAVEFASHRQAAQAFCEGRISQYFGDVDLVRAALKKHQTRQGGDCAADFSASVTGTYEPYAFVLSSSGEAPEFPERISRELYTMFNDGTMESLFRKHFPNTQMSEHLLTLFRINRVPAGGI